MILTSSQCRGSEMILRRQRLFDTIFFVSVSFKKTLRQKQEVTRRKFRESSCFIFTCWFLVKVLQQHTTLLQHVTVNLNMKSGALFNSR